MKKRVVVPKVARVFLCLALVLFIPSLVIDLLENNAIFIYISALYFNISNISPLLFVVAIVLFAIGLILTIIKNVKSNLFRSVTIAIVITVLSYACLIQLFLYDNEVYKEFVSPDNEHIILVSETGVFQSGVIKFYEKTSPFIIKRIAVCNTDDCYLPIENNTYEIKWNDTGFEFHYDFTGSSEEYKIEKIGYIKW